MSDCKAFQQEVERELGEFLRSRNFTLKRCEETDGCRLYYASGERDLCIYDSPRNGEVNGLVREPSSAEWITVSEAIGFGEGLSDAELIDMMPDKPRSTAEMLREVGAMLQQLDT
jgi:hypothetical protein